MEQLSEGECAMLQLAYGRTVRQFRKQRQLGQGRGRPSLAMSQYAMGKALGMDRSYVTALENGDHNPTLTTVWRMIVVLDVRPSVFMRHMARNYEQLKTTPKAAT